VNIKEEALAQLQALLLGEELPPKPDLPPPPITPVIPKIEAAPTPPPPKKALLWDPERYHRATVEDGIADELKAMRAEARGTPFFGRSAPPPDPPLTIEPATLPPSTLRLLDKLKAKR
jgi:hypothetical protein